MKKYSAVVVNEENQQALTERKADLSRIDKEGLLAAIVESSDDAIIAKTLTGEILSWNSGAEKMFGYMAGEVIGKNISLLIPADRIKEEEVILSKISQGERIEHMETIRKKKSGELLNISLSVSPIKNKFGQVLGASKIARDISKRIEANRRKDEFLATLAHELRNPLAPVRTALELISRAGSDAKIVESARNMMERQVTHMARLIDDLMDASRITCGKLKLRCEKIDLRDVIREALDVSRSTYCSKKHDVHVSMSEQPLYVSGDALRLEQALGNLLNNACKYTSGGGIIEVSALEENGQILVTVRDSGVGIEPDLLPEVFNLFMQADNSTERSGGGLGVGLSLVKGLTELHGGSVEAFSEGPGRGSEFTVRLPALLEGRKASENIIDSQDSRQATESRRYLVVDDNQDAAEMLSLLLELEGQETSKAADGLEAIERAEEFRPHIILLDIGLPQLNGYEACRAIREKFKDDQPVIIAITGWGQEEDRRKAKEAGFDGHLVKPVEFEALSAIVESAYQQH